MNFDRPSTLHRLGRRPIKITIGAFVLIGALIAGPIAEACDVAVISQKVSNTGRPIIWKNRDDSNSYFQGIRSYPARNADIGAHTCIEEVVYIINKPICGGGANESGFAVLNASVYSDTNVEETLNVDVSLMKKALENCALVTCFEDLIEHWNDAPNATAVISSNFVAMDAKEGVILLEAHSDIGTRPDVFRVDARETGTANHTNFNRFVANPGIERKERATALLAELDSEDRLTPDQVMKRVAKDVCGDVTPLDPARVPTNKCISRAQTTAAVVIEGVAPGMDPRLTTMWVNLGEPSVGVFVPTFPAARSVPAKMASTNMLGYSAFNLAIVDKEFSLYDNNGAVNSILPTPWMDTTINLTKLTALQSLTQPIEDEAVVRTKAFVNGLIAAPAMLEASSLAAFSQNLTEYAFARYVATGLGSGRIDLKTLARWTLRTLHSRVNIIENIRRGVEINRRYLKSQLPLEAAALSRALAKASTKTPATSAPPATNP